MKVFKETVIGFRVGDYKSGSNEVVEPFSCKNISESMNWLIKRFHEYVNQSAYKPFNVRTHQGHWNQLTVRTNQSNEMLAIVVFYKQNLTDVFLKLHKQSAIV